MVASSLKPNALRAVPAHSIIDAIANAARAWTDRSLPARITVVPKIVARTGYSESVVEFALDQLFRPLTREALIAAITAEIGSVNALDGFISVMGRPDVRAEAVGAVCVIASRTTIGVALWPAIYALCAKCDVTVKDREDHLIAAFFETLAKRDGVFAHAARSQAFSSSDESSIDLGDFECVVAFGKDETLAQIRDACSPVARFIGYGSRASAGYVSEKAARDSKDLARLLEGAARDVVLYDSEGCMSLHVLFAEGESAQQIARDLSSAIEDACHRFPIGKRDASTALQVAAVRSSAAFRQTLNSGVVFSDRAHTFAVTVASSDEPPPFAPRCVNVVAVGNPSEAVDYLEKHAIALEAFALSESRPELIEMAIRAGAVRLTRFGELQKPPVVGNHGGRGRITDFIRWIDREL